MQVTLAQFAVIQITGSTMDTLNGYEWASGEGTLCVELEKLRNIIDKEVMCHPATDELVNCLSELDEMEHHVTDIQFIL